MRRLFPALLLLVGLAQPGCDDPEQTCRDICDEAQALSCTVIDNCEDFCAGATGLRDKDVCKAEYDDYLDCADSTETCEIESRCSAEENAYSNCAGVYCYTHSSDPDCVLLAGSI